MKLRLPADFIHATQPVRSGVSGWMTDNAAFRDVFYSAPDALQLHARVYGPPRAGSLPVVCLPGLTRNARDFHELALTLASNRQVVAFDYRGRGRSAYDADWKKYNLAVETADVLAGLIALGIEGGAFIGTSRGGLIIHMISAIRPAVLKAVVLNDVGPVLDGEGLAHIRAYLERAPRPKSLADAVAIQRAAHGSAFPALTTADWERMVAALYRDENGNVVPDFDPKLLRILGDFDLNKPLPELWPQFEGLRNIPMLVVRGANSKLLSAATLAEMSRRHPDCRTVTVEGQGHAPLLETGALPGLIREFVARADSKSA
jgi:pimeloyl-ACP methyl ester carboxylesterase